MSRQQASVISMPPIGRDRDHHLSADAGGSWAFRPVFPGQIAQSPAEAVQWMDRAAALFYTHALYRAMLLTPASYVAGDGRIRWKAKHEAVQTALDDIARDPANVLIRHPMHEYIRWRGFGMSAYVIENRPGGKIRMNWWDPRFFRGASFMNLNDALWDTFRLMDSKPFVEGVVKIVPTPRGPIRETTVQTEYGQDIYHKGHIGKHDVIALRDRIDSSRGAFDMALVDHEMDQLLDGNLFIMVANTEMSTWGAPDYISTFDDCAKLKETWNSEVGRFQALHNTVLKYFYQGAPSEELQEMINEGWSPEPEETLFMPFRMVKGDMADVEQVETKADMPDTTAFMTLADNRCVQDTRLPMSWFSHPEERVLAALAVESPALKNLESVQGDFRAHLELLGQYAIDTRRMWDRSFPIDAPSDFEVILPDLRQEDASAHLDRLMKLVTLITKATTTNNLDPRIGRLLIREGFAKEDVIEVERFMAELDLEPDDPIPAPMDPTNPLGTPLPARALDEIDKMIVKIANSDPEWLAKMLPGTRTLFEDGNGHGKRQQEPKPA